MFCICINSARHKIFRDINHPKIDLWEISGARHRDEQGTRIFAAPILSSIRVSDLNQHPLTKGVSQMRMREELGIIYEDNV